MGVEYAGFQSQGVSSRLIPDLDFSFPACAVEGGTGDVLGNFRVETNVNGNVYASLRVWSQGKTDSLDCIHDLASVIKRALNAAMGRLDNMRADGAMVTLLVIAAGHAGLDEAVNAEIEEEEAARKRRKADTQTPRVHRALMLVMASQLQWWGEKTRACAADGRFQDALHEMRAKWDACT